MWVLIICGQIHIDINLSNILNLIIIFIESINELFYNNSEIEKPR